MSRRVLYLINYTDYFFSHRLSLAKAAQAAGWTVSVAVPAVSEPYRKRFMDEAIPYRELSPKNKWNSIPQQILNLYGIVSEQRPDLVHVITLKCTLFWAAIAPFFPRQKTLHTIAGFGRLKNRHWFFRLARILVQLVLFLLARFTPAQFIVQNEEDWNYLVQNRLVPPEKLHLILGSGVDVRLFAPRTQTGQPNDCLLVGTASRRVQAKGLPALADAARTLKKDGAPVRFTVAHLPVSPSYSDAIPESAWQSWLADGLFADEGFVEDMPAFYRRLDAFLYLSSYGEGLAKTLLEAAACGLPIITTDRPGCREAVEDGVSGHLVAPGDVESIGRHLTAWHQDPAARAAMGAAGRARAETLFADGKINAETLVLYEAAP